MDSSRLRGTGGDFPVWHLMPFRREESIPLPYGPTVLGERGNRREEIKPTGREHATLEIVVAWRTLWYGFEIKKVA
jgi:hypothetical protein